MDALTNIMFMVEVPADSSTPLEQLEPGKEYLFNLKVLTSKNLDSIKPDAINFFEASRRRPTNRGLHPSILALPHQSTVPAY